MENSVEIQVLEDYFAEIGERLSFETTFWQAWLEPLRTRIQVFVPAVSCKWYLEKVISISWIMFTQKLVSEGIHHPKPSL